MRKKFCKKTIDMALCHRFLLPGQSGFQGRGSATGSLRSRDGPCLGL